MNVLNKEHISVQASSSCSTRKPSTYPPLKSEVSSTSAVPYLESRTLTHLTQTQGSETLKLSLSCAYQTTLTSVMMNVPRLPCSAERFHTPQYLVKIFSFGSSCSCLSWMIAHLNFKSLYNFVVSQLRTTAWKELKRRGLFLTTVPKMNSYRDCQYFVRRKSYNWVPLIAEVFSFISVVSTQSQPTLRLIL